MCNYSYSLAMLSENYESDNDDDDNNDKKELNENLDICKNKNEQRIGNINKLPPVPDSIKNLFNTNIPEENLDCPELHDGRIRSFPHEEGNWATYLFIPYKYDEYLTSICDSLIKICEHISSFNVCTDLHISLSRTVVIRHHWINPLVNIIRKRITILNKFILDFDCFHIYTNDENTRTFIGLKVNSGLNHLIECVKCINESFAEFRLPSYYEDPSFHLSLIWCVGDKKKDLTVMLPVMQELYESFKNYDTSQNITKICCKIGNKFYNFNLN